MEITAENGLKFHDVIYRRQGLYVLAFVICKDKHGRNKYYWGVCPEEDNAAMIEEIMQRGSKWYGKDDDGNILL